jgi:hypothetical protein
MPEIIEHGLALPRFWKFPKLLYLVLLYQGSGNAINYSTWSCCTKVLEMPQIIVLGFALPRFFKWLKL